ncbi:MAG: transglutaminase-like domain-containing protein [Oscillospiraceae bacterium]|nr:transglutaminase-like domain-containing protein [Oscillospiraceae bacterium]
MPKKETIQSVAFPCLLSFVVLLSIMNVYDGVNIFTAIVVFAANFALFCMFEKLRVINKNWLSTLVVIGTFTLANTISILFILGAGLENLPDIMDWFFKGADEDLHIPLYTAALMTFFTPFMASTVFYFTNVRYKAFFVMLTCMTTFAIYAKSLTDIPFIYPSLIIAAFLLIAVERKWYRDGGAAALKYRSFVIIGAGFVTVSAFAAAIPPEVEHTPYRTQFDDFISNGAFAAFGAGGIIDANFSAGASRTPQEQILFLVYADEAGYLRRQVFDEFTGDRWQHVNESRPHTTLIANFSNENFGDSQDIQNSDESFNDYEEGKSSTIIIMNNSSFNYLPTIAYTYDVFGTGLEVEYNIRDEVIAVNENSRNSLGGSGYYVYHNNYPESRTDHLFTDEQRTAYIESTLELPDYYNREQVRELALQLTDGLTPYDAAMALQDHFNNGEFVYDLRATPTTKCVYTFLFETKSGSCSDFATAMTVMAREAGLPARYVSGYVFEEKGDDPRYIDYNSGQDYYVVRGDHAHAFPEVYIEEAGWVLFEPTISGDDSGGVGYREILLAAAAVCGVLALIVFFILFAIPKIREQKFRRGVLKPALSPDKRVALIYARIYASMMKSRGMSARTMSSRDVDACAAEYGVCLRGLTENYDRIVYGGIPAAEGDFFGMYVRFCEGVKASRKTKAKQKR